MASAAALWQPQEEALREICALLEAHISPNSDQVRIWQELHHFGLSPDFHNYLVFLLVRGEGKSFEVRQAAGLLLKNKLRMDRKSFVSMLPASQQYIKSELLSCIGATNRAIRSTVGTVISVLFQIVRVTGWIELLQALHQCLESNDMDHMEGAMDAIYKVAQSKLRDLLLQCCMDEAADVRQSALALLGDISRVCCCLTEQPRRWSRMRWRGAPGEASPALLGQPAPNGPEWQMGQARFNTPPQDG